MKILLFTDSLGAGGAQRQLVGLAVLLSQAGYFVKICTYLDVNFYKTYLDDNGITNEVISGSSNKVLRIFRVAKYFRNDNPDWVIAYQETPSLISCATKFLGCRAKLIVSERSTTQKISLRDRIRFFLYSWANMIIPNSYSQSDFLSSRYRRLEKKIQTISNFVDLVQFAYNEHTRSQIPLIVIAATIWPPKNTLGFIEALRILAQKNIQFKVRWYGYSEAYDEYYKQALSKIDQYGLHKNIELLPKTKNIQAEYRQSDYFCLPSFYEGVPNVIAEAMSTGRPILCSNVCDNPRYVVEGVNGYLFDPNNPENMAEQILKGLSVSDQVYDQMCHESRKRAEEMLSMDTFINKYIEIIEGC